jgi:PAS domain S-box-containing protein
LLAESLREATRRATQGETKEREQREQYRVTLASIGDAVIATDAKGQIAFMNPVAEALTRWTHQDASERPLNEVFRVINEETRQPVSNPALEALEQGLVVGLANHSVLIAKDGTERAIDDSAAPIQTAETGITGAVLVFRDITERRAAQRELMESRERLRITLESIGDAVVATDAQGRVSFANPVAEKLLGYRAEKSAGHPLREVFKIVNEFTRESVANPVEQVLRDGQLVGLANHTVLLRPDGVEIPIDDSAAPIHDHSGSLAGVVLVFRDITERRRAEKTHATLAAIVESSDDAIVSKDLNGRIMTALPRAIEGGRSAAIKMAAGSPPRRIVIVDDSKNQVLSLERLFKRMGHEVHVAYDAAGAVRVMEEFLPEFALIDIGLPGVNGYELARQLREQAQFQNVTLIAQTGWGRDEDRNQARAAGFDYHLVKPIDHQRLAEILTNPGARRES